MEIDELLLKLKPILGDAKIRNIRLIYELDESPEGRQKLIDFLLAKYIQLFHEIPKEKDAILFEPPSKEISDGEYTLGTVHYAHMPFHYFGLREDEFIRSIGIFGIPGSGKTNTAFLIAWNFLQKGKPFLVLDWKRSWRDLLATKEGKDILVFTVGRETSPFFFNPLMAPPGTDYYLWLRLVVQSLAHSYFLGEGCIHLLRKAINAVYLDYNIYDGKADLHPTFQDVYSWLEERRSRGREAQWRESALRAVGSLCFPHISKSVNIRIPVPIQDILNKNIILELDGLTDQDKTFFSEALLLWIFYYRLAQTGKREQFLHSIIIEEAHHLFLKKKMEMSGEETITDRLLRQFRELGEALVIIDQHPSLVSIPALGDTYTIICHNLKHRADVEAASACMLLDTEERKHIGKLEVGWAIMKMQGRYMKPFLIKIPQVNIMKGKVGDEFLMKAFKTEIPEAQKAFNPEQQNIGMEDQTKEERITEALNPEKLPPGDKAIISEDEKKVLEDVLKNPSNTVVQRKLKLHMTKYNLEKVTDRLTERGLVETKIIPIPNGRVHLLALTERGKRFLEEQGYDVGKTHRKGGEEHIYWCERVAEHYRKLGCTVTIEKALGEGKSVDVVAHWHDSISDGINPSGRDKSIAIEIETGKSDAVRNITKCLESGIFDEIIIMALSYEAQNKIMEEAKIAGVDKNPIVRITNIRDFFNLRPRENKGMDNSDSVGNQS